MPRKQGAWIVEVHDEVIIESSEIKALRLATTRGGTATFVEYGQSLSQAKASPAGTESEPEQQDAGEDQPEY